MSEGLGPLNLSDANLEFTGEYEALDPGRYNAEVFAMTTDYVKNTRGTGKLPKGTPMVKVQFKLTDDAVHNRRAFATYPIPPKDYPKEKASQMAGIIANMFIALGDSEEAVKNKSFDPDFEDYIGRECVVVLGRRQKKDSDGNAIPGEYDNYVKGVKPAGSDVTVGAASEGGLL